MRRLLPLALALALLVGTFAGVASARYAEGGQGPAPALAPFDAPAAMPAADRTQSDAWSYRGAAAIGRQIESRAEAGTAAAPAAGGASATVTVTAVVLPVVILVVDPSSGDLVELFTNTPERDARGVVYIVREGSEDGEPATLTPDLWGAARSALTRAEAGTGTIWVA